MAGTNIHRDICGVCSRVQCVSRFSLVQRSRQRRPTLAITMMPNTIVMIGSTTPDMRFSLLLLLPSRAVGSYLYPSDRCVKIVAWRMEHTQR